MTKSIKKFVRPSKEVNMSKSFLLILVLLAMAAMASAAHIYPSDNFDQNTYHYWTPYENGILHTTTTGGTAGSHGYLVATLGNMGDWMPDPSSGLWYWIQGDAAGDLALTTPFSLTDQTALTITPLPTTPPVNYTYPYPLTNPANPYKYYKLDQVIFSGGYYGDFWNSPNTCWYPGDINSGYLISTGMVNLSQMGYLGFTCLKLPGGGGSGYTYVDYATTNSPNGTWTNLVAVHNLQHAGSMWVPYTVELPAVTANGGQVYLRIRFRGNVTGNNAPFNPQPNFWMDDFTITDDEPLPVELSSFTAILTQEYFVRLTWVSQTETGVNGYYIFRGDSNNLSDARIVSPMIPATNTAQTQSYVFTDTDLYDSGTYYYWLQNVDYDGTESYHGPISVYYDNSGNTPAPPVPLFTELKAVYPNPFNPTVFIPFSLASSSDVSFKIYNQRGQIVKHFELGNKAAGDHRISWDGTDYRGQTLSNGVYHIVMNAGNQSFVRKAVLLK